MTITPNGGGGLTLGFYGIPASLWQRPSNLVDWVTVATNTAPVSGPETGWLEFTDTPPHTPAFYRAWLP